MYTTLQTQFLYPAYLGDIFESRYQVLSKLGYGSRSTVWLSRHISLS